MVRCFQIGQIQTKMRRSAGEEQAIFIWLVTGPSIYPDEMHLMWWGVLAREAYELAKNLALVLCVAGSAWGAWTSHSRPSWLPGFPVSLAPRSWATFRVKATCDASTEAVICLVGGTRFPPLRPEHEGLEPTTAWRHGPRTCEGNGYWDHENLNKF